MNNEVAFDVSSWAGFEGRMVDCDHCDKPCNVGVVVTSRNEELRLCRPCSRVMRSDLIRAMSAQNMFDEILFEETSKPEPTPTEGTK